MYTCAKYPPVMFRLYCLLRRPRLVSRMQSSMSLISAHKIFAKSLPVPPQWSKEVTLSSQQCRNSIAPSETPLVFPDSSICSAQWKECGEHDWSLKTRWESSSQPSVLSIEEKFASQHKKHFLLSKSIMMTYVAAI